MLDAMNGAPAFVCHGRMDVLAVNQPGSTLCSETLANPRRPVNSARYHDTGIKRIHHGVVGADPRRGLIIGADAIDPREAAHPTVRRSHADHEEQPRDRARAERLVHRRGLRRHGRGAVGRRRGSARAASTSRPAPAPPGTPTRTARRSGSPRASASASAAAARSRSSAPATASSSSPARSTGTAPRRTRFMTHIAMLEVDDDGNPATWGDHVSDEEYCGGASDRPVRSHESCAPRTERHVVHARPNTPAPGAERVRNASRETQP